MSVSQKLGLPPHPPWELASVAPANVSVDAGQALHLHHLYRTCTPAAVSPDTQALACRLLRPAASVAPPGGESTNPGSRPPAPLQELFTRVAPGFQTPCTHRGRHPEYPNHRFHSAWSRLTRSVSPQRRLNPAGGNMGSRPDVWGPQRKGATRNSKLWVCDVIAVSFLPFVSSEPVFKPLNLAQAPHA